MGVPSAIKISFEKVLNSLSKKSSKSKEALALYFEPSFVVAAILELQGEKSTVKQISRSAMDAALPEDEKRKILVNMLSTFKRKYYPSAWITWADGITFRQLPMPEMPEADLRQAFAWDLKKKYFFNPDENQLGFVAAANVDGEEGPEKLYDLFCVDRKAVASRLELVQSLGLEVEMLIPAQMSVAMAVKASGLVSKALENDTCICDWNDGIARIMMVSDGKPLLVRNVTLASPGSPMTDELIVKLSDEIQKSIDFYAGQKLAKPVGEVVLTGSGYEEAPLRSFMEKHLDAPLKFLDAAAVTGAPLVHEPSLNLLPDVMKKKNQEKQLNDLLKMGFFGSILIALMMIAWPLLEINILKVQLQSIEKESTELLKSEKVFLEFTAKERVRRTAMRGRIRHAALLKELSRATPPAIIFQEMQFTRLTGNWVIRGIANDPGKANVDLVTQFVASLSDKPFFKNVELASTNVEPETERLKFEIRGLTKGVE